MAASSRFCLGPSARRTICFRGLLPSLRDFVPIPLILPRCSAPGFSISPLCGCTDRSVRATSKAELVPGFAVLVVEAGAAIFFAAEEEAGGADGVDGDYVPGVLGDDVGDEKVDF